MAIDYGAGAAIAVAVIAIVTPVYRWVTSHQALKQEVEGVKRDVVDLKAADVKHVADSAALRGEFGLIREGLARVEAILGMLVTRSNGGKNE